jgi:hypothetical protein
MVGFKGLCIKAGKGDREPLIDYFLYGGIESKKAGKPIRFFHLSEEDGEWLAWLVEKLPQAKHRPRGTSSPTNLALRAAVYLFRLGKREWCKKHGCDRVSPKTNKAIVDNLAKRALELVERPNIGKITADAVRIFKKPATEDDALEYFGAGIVAAVSIIKRAALKS